MSDNQLSDDRDRVVMALGDVIADIQEQAGCLAKTELLYGGWKEKAELYRLSAQLIRIGNHLHSLAYDMKANRFPDNNTDWSSTTANLTDNHSEDE